MGAASFCERWGNGMRKSDRPTEDDKERGIMTERSRETEKQSKREKVEERETTRKEKR